MRFSAAVSKAKVDVLRLPFCV